MPINSWKMNFCLITRTSFRSQLEIFFFFVIRVTADWQVIIRPLLCVCTSVFILVLTIFFSFFFFENDHGKYHYLKYYARISVKKKKHKNNNRRTRVLYPQLWYVQYICIVKCLEIRETELILDRNFNILTFVSAFLPMYNSYIF